MLFALFFTSVFSTVALAANDWSKPCFSGVCEYDLPASSGSASGTLKIWGSENSIADITTSAGWEIIDCSPDVLKQDIRLVCKEDKADDCAKLYDAGAEGKIVRLPENCGSNAFAGILKAYIPQDQNIPDHVARGFQRRDGTLPEVKALKITTDFKSLGTSGKAGSVNFAIRAANVPGASGTLDVPTGLQGRKVSRVYERGLFDIVKAAIDKLKSLNDFNIDKSKVLPPVDVNKNFTLIDESVSCPPLDARLKVDVEANAHASASIGVAVTGTILPPKIDDFAVITSLSADLQGAMDIAAGITGTADSGKIPIVDIGILGLSFPGILEIGPSFQINAQAKATLDVDLTMNVGVNYKISNAKLIFPPSSDEASGGSFSIEDTPLKLSVSPAVKATGTLEAHIIPSLNLGLSALDGVADATIFLEADASATLNLSLEASATVVKTNSSKSLPSVSAKPAHQKSQPGEMAMKEKRHHVAKVQESSSASSSVITTEIPTLTPAGVTCESATKTITLSPVTSTVYVTATAHPTGAPPSSTPMKGNDNTSSDNTSSKSFSGCVDVGAGLDVNAGANADFFGLFNKETKVSLFSKKFELFKKCFGNSPSSASSRRTISSRFFPKEHSRSPLAATYSPRSERQLGSRAILDLLCPAVDTPAAEAVTDETLAVADIKEL
ncbi:hypothetical protein D9613_010283 [Agrocybe pediades]|uniref:DUF7223 domain-containing protein n=1 Tax=Agrocybe pediades TaxID=84607 RepID=A0A8H4QGI7_9AGAR|nr:hypothetical protein D9613_010283 [Agrocybe pediades]